MRLCTGSIALVSCLAFTSPGLAQRGAPGAQPFTVGEIATGSCWIDAATGARVETYPAGFKPGLDDPNHFYRPGTSDGTVAGKNFTRASDGSWVDAATGVRVNSYPAGFKPGLDDPNHFYRPGTSDGTVAGKNFAKIPCPPPPQSTEIQTPHSSSWAGPFGGVQFVGSWSGVGTNEYLATTGVRTNAFDDSGNGFGGGVNFGYDWQPWSNNVVVGVVFDINGLNDKVDHGFGGGTFIGSTVNVTGSAQVRAGVLATPSLLLYGQTGLSVADQRLQINFGGAITDQSQVTPGFSLGGGAEWMLPINPIPSLAKSTSLFISYDHTWWDKASLETPAASPLFNYTWLRQSDAVEIGARLRF